MKKHNFNAGPSILADEVLENAAKAIIDFNGSGLSLLSISHRIYENLGGRTVEIKPCDMMN